MIRTNKKTLVLLLFLWFAGGNLSCFGFDGPIKIRRVCLNPSDSVATLYFNSLNDNCGTFTKIEVFGRIVKVNPTAFILLSTELTLPNQTISLQQQDLKQWEYFIRFHTQCDGVTIFDSDTVSVDIFPPIPVPLDSVSVNQTSQKVVVGWSKNPSPDLNGYLVFKQVGGNNVQISNQKGEGYTDIKSNPQFGALSYSYNSYDSCTNINTISEPHVTIFLSRNFDFCQRQISLNWTPYVGWNTEKYYIYQSTNAGAYTIIDSTTQNKLTLKNSIPGASYCFFIRAKKTGSSFTSSSNRTCLAIPNPPIPQNSRIKSISVQDNNTMRIKWYTEQSDQAKSIELFRGPTLTSLTRIAVLPRNNGDNYYLDNTNTQESSYFYRIIVYDSCAQDNDTSNIAQSVFLRLADGDLLTWSSFVFTNDTNDGDYLFYQSSSWNNITVQSPQKNQTYQINAPDSAYCYQVISISKLGDSSLSNIICTELALHVFIPNAIQLNGSGVNSAFGVYGTGIDWEKSFVHIYTRWGEKIHELNSAGITWDGKYQNKKVPAGIYMYNGLIFGKRNEKVQVKGTIIILD